jgi:hypothetical protein
MNAKTTSKETFVAEEDAALFTENLGDRSAAGVLLIVGAMTSGVWWPASFRAQLAGLGRFVIRYDHRDTGRRHVAGRVSESGQVASLRMLKPSQCARRSRR